MTDEDDDDKEEDEDDEDDDDDYELEFEFEIEADKSDQENEELTLEAIYESIHENQTMIEQLHVLYQLTFLEVKKLNDLLKEKKFFHYWN